jgi:hypothetical protein
MSISENHEGEITPIRSNISRFSRGTGGKGSRRKGFKRCRRTSIDTTRYRMSALIVPLLYPDSVTTSPHGLACWSRMPNGGNVKETDKCGHAQPVEHGLHRLVHPSTTSINKRMAWRSDASEIASRSPATNAISPFPESSGPRRHQETESR